MTNTSSLADTFQTALGSAGSAVEVVNVLLTVCSEQEVYLRLGPGSCRIQSSKLGGPEESVPNLVSKTKFRAVLARFVALCNEKIAGTVSPSGGQGLLPIGPDQTKVMQVQFANTQEEQFIEIRPAGPAKKSRPPRIKVVVAKLRKLQAQVDQLSSQVESLTLQIQKQSHEGDSVNVRAVR